MSEEQVQRKLFKAQEGMQARFLQSGATEVFFGGEAGGGKSAAMIMAALRYYREKGYHAVVFRRNYPDLEDLIHKTMEMYLPLGFKFNAQKHLFVHEEYGSRVRFSHLSHINDIYSHAGQEYDFIGFDELCQFPKLMYTYLFSRLRGPNPKIRRIVRGTGNPDGEGLLWVKARFVDCLDPLKPKWFLTDKDRDVEVPPGTPGAISRMFIPCLRHENKILMANDPQYEAMLNQLPEDKKRAYKYGIWDHFDKPFQLVRTAWLQKAISGDVKAERGIPAIGADYAESGDMCALCVGVGNRVVKFMEWPGMDTDRFVEKILKEAEKLASVHGLKQVRIGVDSVGPGTGVYHALRKTAYASQLDPMRYKDETFDNNWKNPTIRTRFNNLRSQMWWKLSHDMQKERIDLSDLQSEKAHYDNLYLMQEELLAHTYEEKNGLIQIVDKATLRKPEHLGRSPDRADALIIWNWVRDRHRPPVTRVPASPHFNPDFAENRAMIRQNLYSGYPLMPDENPNAWQAL